MKLTLKKIIGQIIELCDSNLSDPRIECNNACISEGQLRQLTDALVIPALSTWLKINNYQVRFSSQGVEDRDLIKKTIQDLEDNEPLEDTWRMIFANLNRGTCSYYNHIVSILDSIYEKVKEKISQDSDKNCQSKQSLKIQKHVSITLTELMKGNMAQTKAELLLQYANIRNTMHGSDGYYASTIFYKTFFEYILLYGGYDHSDEICEVVDFVKTTQDTLRKCFRYWNAHPKECKEELWLITQYDILERVFDTTINGILGNDYIQSVTNISFFAYDQLCKEWYDAKDIRDIATIYCNLMSIKGDIDRFAVLFDQLPEEIKMVKIGLYGERIDYQCALDIDIACIRCLLGISTIETIYEQNQQANTTSYDMNKSKKSAEPRLTDLIKFVATYNKYKAMESQAISLPESDRRLLHSVKKLLAENKCPDFVGVDPKVVFDIVTKGKVRITIEKIKELQGFCIEAGEMIRLDQSLNESNGPDSTTIGEMTRDPKEVNPEEHVLKKTANNKKMQNEAYLKVLPYLKCLKMPERNALESFFDYFDGKNPEEACVKSLAADGNANTESLEFLKKILRRFTQLTSSYRDMIGYIERLKAGEGSDGHPIKLIEKQRELNRVYDYLVEIELKYKRKLSDAETKQEKKE